jgi:type II secretory pathway component GspD/PulD (secretin)
VSFDVKNLDLREFLDLIGKTGGLNVIVDPSATNTEPFDLRLTDVPWDQALDIVLRQNRLVAQLNGNVLRIRQAPTPAPESITMDFEIYRSGSLLGAPRITTILAHGATLAIGSVSGSEMKITATPSRTIEGKIRIELEIFVGNSGTREVLIVSSGEQRSISWRSSAGEPLEARITAVEII